MIDRLLAVALNSVIVTLIAALSATTLVCAHWAVVRLLGGSGAAGTSLLLVAASAALAAFLLIRYRNDLVDR